MSKKGQPRMVVDIALDGGGGRQRVPAGEVPDFQAPGDGGHGDPRWR